MQYTDNDTLAALTAIDSPHSSLILELSSLILSNVIGDLGLGRDRDGVDDADTDADAGVEADGDADADADVDVGNLRLLKSFLISSQIGDNCKFATFTAASTMEPGCGVVELRSGEGNASLTAAADIDDVCVDDLRWEINGN